MRPFVARAGLGYGWTEAVLHMKDQHHRMQLDASGGFTPLPWLSTSLRVLGRYDLHTGGSNGSDYGVITETHLAARTSFPAGADWRAGAELALWLPAGENVGKAFAAVSGDLQFLLAYAPAQSPLSLGLALGLRMDRSRQAGGQLERYSLPDRLALGASDDIWAAREGLALSYRVGALEWVAEWAFRMYFAHILQSPMWLRAGARWHPTDRIQLELLAGVSPSKRPDLTNTATLGIVEPRVWAGLAAAYAWEPRADVQPEVARAPTPPAEEVSAPPTPTTLAGHVLAPGGAGLAGASVRLEATTSRERTTDGQGHFVFSDLPAGDYELVVSADGFKPDHRSLALQAGASPELSIALERELPIGQIRGTVRRFDGSPVRAQIAIPALDSVQQCREDGTFELNVPPGDYTVKVSADGFHQQSRTAHVELRGVAILIIELEPNR